MLDIDLVDSYILQFYLIHVFWLPYNVTNIKFLYSLFSFMFFKSFKIVLDKYLILK